MSDNATDTRTLIHLDGVGKTYPGTSVPAVAELNLDIHEGEILVLVGPSGCGKSTTLRLINRMIEPSSGRIIFDGEDVTTVNPDLLRIIEERRVVDLANVPMAGDPFRDPLRILAGAIHS